MNIGPEYPSYEIPVENLRFDEMPPEAQIPPEAFEGDPTSEMMTNLMAQMLEDVGELTVHLQNSQTLLLRLHTSLVSFGRKEYPAEDMAEFLRSNEDLLRKIVNTYVPAVDNPENEG